MTPSFVSLFAGAGGLDLGLEEGGWECRYAADIDKAAVETLRLNQGFGFGSGCRAFSGTFIEQADVVASTGEEILAKLGSRRGDIQLLAGGPPCQSWSSAGHQRGFGDPRGGLLREYVRIAGELDVRWFIFENVRGLLTARGPDGEPGSALTLVRKSLLEAGFQTTVSLLNAADYGAPQRRVRLFMIGFRAGDAPPFPMPTHAKLPDLASGEVAPWVTLGEALSEIEPPREDEIVRPKGRLAIELAELQPGTGVKSPGKKESTRPGGHWGYKQGAFVADLQQSARTVTASAQQDWIKDRELGLRRLSPRECAALQTFPEGWQFGGASSNRYKLIGNAVPPRLAAAIGRELRAFSSSVGEHVESIRTAEALLPLPPALASAVRYTMREEAANGASRRQAPSKRASRFQLSGSATS